MKPVLSALEAADLIDRFLRETPLYPQEWNDFIEATKVAPQVELYRKRCYELDPLLNHPGDPDLAALNELKEIENILRAA